MSFYLRDSIRFGPFRLNLSKSGIGLSVGVTGLRVGIGPRGAYLHAGRDGVYYRRSLGGGSAPAQGSPDTLGDVSSDLEPAEPTLAVAPVPEGDAAQFVSDLNAASHRRRIRGWLTVVALLVTIQVIATRGAIGWLGFALILPIWIVCGRIDRRRCSIAHDYDDAAISAEPYQTLIAAFAGLAASEAKFQLSHGSSVTGVVDWKRRAGVDELFRRTPIRLDYRLPAALRSEIRPPEIKLARGSLFLMPDGLLVEVRRSYALLAYGQLDLAYEPSSFVEPGRPPSDAEILSRVWSHPNKDGGPDRRFRSNPKLANCRYEALILRHPAVLLHFSKRGSVASFVAALQAIGGREPAPSSISAAPCIVTAPVDNDTMSTFDKMVRSAAMQASESLARSASTDTSTSPKSDG
jgi:hypothetical protein